MKAFFHLLTTGEFRNLLLDFEPVAPEEISLEEGMGRVTAQDILAGEDLPPFPRSTMDGFAVRARDCFGAAESEPALLSVVGEIKMGDDATDLVLRPGQCAKIWTGGRLPEGADAVVMLEYAREVGSGLIEVFRAVAPYENVIEQGQDYHKEEVVIQAGTKLRAQELGVLAGLGILRLQVRKRPLAVIISTGDELVPENETPSPGKIRDINSTTLSALATSNGCQTVRMGIVKDSYEAMSKACQHALNMGADLVLISGGSSVGNRDFTLKVFQDLEGSRVLAHGVAIRPGKPTMLARKGNTMLFGLPGHVGSAMVVYWLFVRFAINVLLGADPEKDYIRLPVKCGEPFPSVMGREDYVRVILDRADQSVNGQGGIVAYPVHGKSGLISTLVKADGLLVVPRDVEGFHQGEDAEVLIFP